MDHLKHDKKIPNPWTTENGLEILDKDPLGEGSFGRVWKAVHKDDKNQYAIKQIFIAKTLKYYLEKNPFETNVFEKLLREVENHSKLNTSFVVKYYSYWFEGPDADDILNKKITNLHQLKDKSSKCEPQNFLWIQMEFCVYPTMTEFFKTHPDFGSRKEEVARIFNQLAKALMVIHSHGIIHRDLKPDNILCTGNYATTSPIWKIADFGLSIRKNTFLKGPQQEEPQASTSKSTMTVLTSLDTDQNTSFAGTSNYKSPEMNNGELYTVQTDIYSLGVILLQTIGSFPSMEKQLDVILDLLLKDKVRQPKFIAEELIKYLPMDELPKESQLIQRMLQHNPELRPTAEEAYKETIVKFNYGVAIPHPNFTGRQHELNSLRNMYMNASVNNNIAVVAGLPGVGKSELVKKFVQSMRQTEDVCCICLNGKTISLMNKSALGLAEDLDVRTRHDGVVEFLRQTVDIFDDIYKTLSTVYSKYKTILVVDGIDADMLAELKPDVETIPVALIIFVVTTFDYESEAIMLHRFSPDEAFEFVSTTLLQENVQTAMEHIKTLCNLLKFHPGTLRQAVNIIIEQKRPESESSYSVRSFLDDHARKILELSNLELDDIDEFSQNIAATSAIAIDHIRSSSNPVKDIALEILDILSYVDPNGISYTFLQFLMTRCLSYPIPADKTEYLVLFVRCWDLLQKYSLAGFSSTGKRIWILPVVQKFIKFQAKQQNREEELILKIMNGLCTTELHYMLHEFITNLLIVLKSVLMYENLVKEFADFICQISARLVNLAMVNESIEFNQSTLPIFIKVFGDNNPFTLQILHHFGSTLQQIKRHEEALEIYNKVLLNGSLLGADHEIIIGATYQKATVLLELEKYDEAIQLYETVVDKEEIIYGVNLKAIKLNIAMALSYQGKDDESMTILKEVLEWQRTNLGEDHFATLKTKQAMASCLFHLDKDEDAERMFKQVLKAQIKVLGEDNLETLRTKSCLATALAHRGEVQEAVQILQHVLSVQENVLGEDHPETEATRNEIAEMFDSSVPE